MQRVRIGLTGLASVFLLVLLAAAFFGLANHEQASGPLVVAPTSGAADNGVEAPREPLAELGVAPGGGEAAGNAVTPGAPAVVPPPSPRTGR